MLRILVQTRTDKLLVGLGEVPLKLGGFVLGNEEKGPHGVQLRIGWLPVSQLYGRHP